VRDGILTLPAALEIREPTIAKTFCKPDPTPLDLSALAAAFATKLPEAEACLDWIAGERRAAKRGCSRRTQRRSWPW
jgi:hypothetical protein